MPTDPSSETARPQEAPTESVHTAAHAPTGSTARRAAGLGLAALLSIPCATTSRPLAAEDRAHLLATVQPGDILLRNRNGYPLWNLYERLQFGSADFNHAALYVGDGKVIESVPGRGVVERNLERWLDCNQAAVARPRYKSAEQREAALAYARSKMGTPYDAFFAPGEDELYCSELVSHALQQGDGSPKVPWTTFLGVSKVGPDAFLHAEDIDVVWSSSSELAANLASHWPTLSAVAAGAGIGAWVGGPAGAVVGALSSIAACPLLSRVISS